MHPLLLSLGLFGKKLGFSVVVNFTKGWTSSWGPPGAISQAQEVIQTSSWALPGAISQPWPKKCSKRAPQGLLESFRSPGPKSAPNELLRASWKKCSKRAPEGLLEQFRSADRKSAPNELLRAFLEPFEFAALAQQVLQTSSWGPLEAASNCAPRQKVVCSTA